MVGHEMFNFISLAMSISDIPNDIVVDDAIVVKGNFQV